MLTRLARSRRRSRLLRVLALAVVIVVGCRGLTDPPLPPGAVAFAPPPAYARWWAMTEACAGRSGPLEAVTWFVVPGTVEFEFRGRMVAGYWSAGSNRIVLAGKAQYDGPAVRHEMLHALVRRAGHSSEMFLERCGGVVVCNACVADRVAPTPDPNAVVVSSEFLDVSIDVALSDPSPQGGDGFITLTVVARNPAAYPVSVARATPGMLTFSYELKGEWENRVRGLAAASHPELTMFAPGETKRHVFDFRIVDDGYGDGIAPGEHTLVGGYGRKSVSAVIVVR